MLKQLFDYAPIAINRKRAHIWPFATRTMCEQHAIKLLGEDKLSKELPPLPGREMAYPPFNVG
jgi:hypothetical protein